MGRIKTLSGPQVEHPWSRCLMKIEFSVSNILQIKLFCRKAKISDAYTESTENFPDTYLALCSGKKLSERISTSKYLSPLSYDECLNSKIAAASLDFLNRHRELEQQDNRVIKQVNMQLMTTDLTCL